MCRSVFQQVYYVPEDAVISLPKAPFEIESGAALGMLLSSKAPDKWLAAMQPESLLMLRGKEGKSVYVLFTVPGHPTEQRFIRHVIASVAEKAFPKLLAELDADPDKAPVNERQRLRRQVLHWRAVDCNGPQIDPKYNDWELCSEPLKSCKLDPVPVPRPLNKKAKVVTDGLDECAIMPEGVSFVRSLAVRDTDGYHVFKRPNQIVVVQFEGQGASRDAEMAPALEL
mgnify:CR=1 FL=1